MPRARMLRAALLVAGALLFFVLPSIVGFAADWLWFDEVGHLPIFLTALTARSVVGVLAFVVAAAWLAANVRQALAGVGAEPISITTPEGFNIVLPTREQLRPLALLVAVGVALLIAVYASSEWMTVLAWRHATTFGVVDPILGYDTSFYVFTLPFLALVHRLAFLLVVAAAIGAAVLYAMAGRLTLSPFGLRMPPAVWRHASVLAAVLFLVLAFGAWLDRPGALVSVSGIIQGASYADVHARMPASLLLTFASIAGAVLAFVHARGHVSWALPAAVALYAVVLFGGQIYAGLLQRFVVGPNEQAREAPFIAHNIEATRQGFALDRIEERELSGDAELTRADIDRNRETLDNVPLWDHQPLLETFGQIQEIRTYYDFIAVDNDRYRLSGQNRQVMLSARELNPAALPNRTWINERLVFTHGHGLTLGPVNQVTSEGLPVLFVRDLPPVATGDLAVSQPSIYFGELSNEYVIGNTRAGEFHYPKGEDNVFTRYDGRGGIVLSSLLRKLLFAVQFRAYQILLSDDITTESRLMFDRQIRRRVMKIAPFLVYDEDPYLVIDESGRLFWMQDAYTTSARYPYSSGAGGVNYIRNAVKITIDAYHGTPTFYLAEPDDPLVRTLASVFPSLLRPIADMPEDLRRHVRYPEGIFKLQSSVYSTYHMTNPAVFYNKEDQWEIPAIDRGGETVAMEPYYTIMNLPGATEAEFIQMLPFTPRRRDNLASWLVARSDPDRYGQLFVFRFPKQKLVFGPRQVVGRINQDQVIAPQITLWNQQGSEVIQGTLMVIPIEESLIYIRPLYLRAQAGRIPELTRVIVAYQNQIVMERTLEAAIDRIFGTAGGAPPVTVPPPAAAPVTEASTLPVPPVTAPGLAQLAEEANQIYRRALDAQRAGDWATYGEEIRRLGELLVKMQAGRER
ncbi:MAG: UPF0182 family protein [Vicinamibacterales bacterium]